MSEHTIAGRGDLRGLNLEQQRKRAKELLKGCREGDPDALSRVDRYLPGREGAAAADPDASNTDASDTADEPESSGDSGTSTDAGSDGITLAFAQFVVARENGFASWARMKAHIEAESRDMAGRAGMLVSAACSGRMGEARDLLAAWPAIATADISTASALGEIEAVERFLRRNPSAATARGGPDEREPLLYLSFSRFLGSDPERAPRMVRTAELLLKHGADPNAYFTVNDDPNARQTALYGAAGIANNADLTRLLLDAGADPNDGAPGWGPESLYHASEFNDTTCLRLILEHKPEASKVSYCLARMLDFENPAGVRLYLEHGADPNFTVPWWRNESHLHKAIRSSRSAEIVEMLLSYGADIRQRTSEGATPLSLAVRYGDAETVELLRRHGAGDEEVSPADRLVGASLREDGEEVARIIGEQPGLVDSLLPRDLRMFVDAGRLGRTEGVRIMLDAGFDIGVRGDEGMTALHWACWYGHLETIELLLERAAPLTVKNSYDGDVLSCTVYASREVKLPGVDYGRIVHRLIEAGASVDSVSAEPTGNPAVDAVLAAARRNREG